MCRGGLRLWWSIGTNARLAQPSSREGAAAYGGVMAPTMLDDATPVIGPRSINDTGVVVHPLALDGGIFGWAAGVNDSASVLDHFHAAGGNLITTADHFAGGRS